MTGVEMQVADQHLRDSHSAFLMMLRVPSRVRPHLRAAS